MRTTARLSGDERREAIVKAVRQAFAEKGFHGTTTKELAEAAGVSEALLFKHFPSKEALYCAVQCSCGREQAGGEIQKMMALEPSTSTLVHMVHFLVSKMVRGWTRHAADEQTGWSRLMLRSLMEDGELARTFLKRFESGWMTKFEQCAKAAEAAGELLDCPVPNKLRGWFVHHLAVMIMIHLIPSRPVVDYGMSREKLVEHAVRFALRGIGLKDDVIKRYYNPSALSLVSG